MSHILVDEEQLETLAYERSKVWSSFLKRYEDIDEGKEIEVHAIDQLYKDEDDEDEYDGIEEADEETVEEDVNNTTAFMSKTELTQMLCSGDNKEIFNQTLPIVEEHVRKWKEAGLDRILNTFDAQKIEQHVGDWMRRHNSAYGDKTLLQVASPKKRHKAHTGHYCLSSGSETESMHSMDTARYIRASRKRTSPSSVTKCSSSRSPMTTIKMYRTLPRKRDELRAKYGCDEEQEHRRHMQAVLHRRDRRKRERELIYHTSPRHYPYAKAVSISNGQPSRRKQLHKRLDSSPLFPSSTSCSSSSDDERAAGGCNCSACVRRVFSKTTAYPYCSYRTHQSHRNRSYHHHHRHHHQLSTRSMHSTMHFKHIVRKLQCQNNCEEDMRPRLLETDCNCCTKERLCSKVLHIANSSTEEWLVENRSSPDPGPLLETPKSSMTREQIAKQKIEFIKVESDVDEDDTKELPTTSRKQLAEKTKALVTFSEVESRPGKAIPKSILKATPAKIPNKLGSQPNTEIATPAPNKTDKTLTQIKETVTKPDITKMPKQIRETFVKPNPPSSLKKQAAKKVQSSKAKNSMDKSSEKSQDDNKTQRKTTTKEKSNNRDDDVVEDQEDEEVTDDNNDKDLKLALALSKKSYYAERRKLRQRATKKPAKDSLKQIPEQSTIFNNQSVACNSTALSNDVAGAKQIQKSVAASSSLALIDLCSLESIDLPDGEADCTVVTSTTGCEAAPVPVTAAQSPAEPDADTTPIQRPKLTNKGILLYAPGSDQSQSQQSFSSNSSVGNFTLTEHALNPIIGQRRALKFIKYHMGHRSFDSRYSVYYRPSAKLAALLQTDAKSLDLQSSSSSGSDDDIFERVQRYGDVYTVLEKCNDQT
ncbi:uncharacterized protein LOC6567306 [Drosophila grimshawi]|uniref:GH21560 n=1 Tax=Drosophila grimshawi TaxID=7222 RepID=B4JRW1_DROGR|nr:uncharacterized protein LOC6567306 [Drosophila grimshawi]EDV94501.1 GH21560 [Drosophila grimshawi]